jgi:hypothetical protein
LQISKPKDLFTLEKFAALLSGKMPEMPLPDNKAANFASVHGSLGFDICKLGLKIKIKNFNIY